MSVEKKINQNWPVTCERYVAFIDIMGFKDMVARSSHEEIYDMMKNINKVKRELENVKWTDIDDRITKSTFYSDSIIIYSKDNSINSAQNINSTISALTNDLLASGIPHKGAIAFGKMTRDERRSIFFGQPLIDAYLLQEQLNLYCIVVDASAEHQFEKQNLIDNEKLMLKNYLCNFKLGASNHLTIPPLFAGVENADSEPSKKQKKRLIEGIKRLRHKTSGHLRKYVDNTEAFIKYVETHFEIF
jgi:hypothetical protein